MEFSHPTLTGGKPVEIKPLTLAAEKARLALLLDQKKRGIDGSELATVEMFELVAFHTLKRVLPDITQAAVSEELDAKTAKALGDLIAQANKADESPKATAP